MALEKPGKLGIYFSYFVATLYGDITLLCQVIVPQNVVIFVLMFAV